MSRVLLLLVPSVLLVGLMFFHSWHRRGLRLTVGFYAAGAVFGVLRAVLVRHATVDQLESLMPYIFLRPGLKLGPASFQEIIGWLFACYLGWSLAEAILERIPGMAGRLFPTIGLTLAGLGAVSYAVETAAGAMGWWYWTIPMRNLFFHKVPVVGVIDWSFVAVDLLLPLLLFLDTRLRRKWLLVPVIPMVVFHMAAHTSARTLGRFAPITYFDLWHALIAAGLYLLIVFSPLGLRSAERRRGRPPAPLAGRVFPLVMAAVTVAVVLASHLAVARDPRLCIALVPLAGLVLLSLPAVPLGATYALAGLFLALGWLVWPVTQVATALLPVGLALLLQAVARARSRPRLSGALAAAVPVALALMVAGSWLRERDFERYHVEVRAAVFAGQAAGARLTAGSLPERWRDATFHHQQALLFGQLGLNAAAVDEYRLALEGEPDVPIFRLNLGGLYHQLGRTAEARRELERALEMAPYYGQAHANLGRLLLESGDAAAAIPHLRSASDLLPEAEPPLRALAEAYRQTGQPALAAAARADAERLRASREERDPAP